MKIAVFYHCIVSGGGGGRNIDTSEAVSVVREQMHALKTSGLLAEASEFHVAVNGERDDVDIVRMLVPCPRAQFVAHGAQAATEIPTMNMIRHWAGCHPGWVALYHHTKGVSHPPIDYTWRRNMEQEVVWRWRACVADLQAGFDAVGSYWLTPEVYPGIVSSPFFGGTFWWAQSRYLAQLPELPPDVWDNRMQAEMWIGRRRPYPLVKNYIGGWPPSNSP